MNVYMRFNFVITLRITLNSIDPDASIASTNGRPSLGYHKPQVARPFGEILTLVFYRRLALSSPGEINQAVGKETIIRKKRLLGPICFGWPRDARPYAGGNIPAFSPRRI